MSDLEILAIAMEAALKKVNLKEIKEVLNDRQEKPALSKVSHEVELSSKYNDDYYEKYANEYIEFTYANPTIFHVVDYFAEKLNDEGFKYLPEKDSWKSLEPGKYYTIRHGTSLAAFIVGKNWSAEKGVGIIGSHIDSLTVPLKPNSTKEKIDGYELLGVAAYAGTLNDLWLDRDLGIGGSLLVRDPATKRVNQQLVDSTPHPIARIPTLAPHFGAASERPYNKETQTVPVIGYSGPNDDETEASDEEKSSPLYGRHPLKLLRYIASLAGVRVSEILQWDLQLYDIQKGVRGGLNKEFIFSPRIDDRICSFAAIHSLLESNHDSIVESDSFSLVALYNHEEIGSGSATGAKGGITDLVISRVLSSKYYNPDDDLHSQEQLKLAYANSIILSADVNHLLNPNFTSEYLEHHKPVPNKGITIAVDPNGHFATDAPGLALAEELARINDDSLQYFQVRNGSRSGSSIGPLISLQTGARTIDLGISQLSMHSIRATVGFKDIGLGIKFFNGFFSNWRKTYDSYATL